MTFIELCKEAYYAGNPIISDSKYDAIVEILGEEYVGTKNGTVAHKDRVR